MTSPPSPTMSRTRPRLWCPLLTHYSATGAVDRGRMRAHLDRLRPHVQAFLIPGSTGDGWQMTDGEARTVLEFAVEQAAADGFTLLVGALKQTPAETCRFITETASWLAGRPGAGNVAGYAACPPTGADVTPSAMETALTQVLALGHPTGLYQLPQVTRNRMPPDLLARLAGRFPNFVLFKDSSGEDAVALSGEAMPGVFMVRGAEGDYARWLREAGGPYDGFLLSTANVFPGELAALVAHVEAGRTADAGELSGRVSGCVREVFAHAAAALPTGNAFANANKALDHVLAWGPERALREETPLPVLHGGARLPRAVVEGAADSLRRWRLMPDHGYLLP